MRRTQLQWEDGDRYPPFFIGVLCAVIERALPKLWAAFLAAMIASQVFTARAQTTIPVSPTPLHGFSQNCNMPVLIQSAILELRDKEKIATFLGNVRLVQGDITLHSNTLVVYFEDTAATKAAPSSQSRIPAEQRRIRRLEAKGSVVVSRTGQTATGEIGIVDLASNTAMLDGNVVLTQGRNILRGDRLLVDLTTGVPQVESKNPSGGRIRAVLQPDSNQNVNQAVRLKTIGAFGTETNAADVRSNSALLRRFGT